MEAQLDFCLPYASHFDLYPPGETPNTHLAKRARDLAVHEVKQIKNLKGLEKSSLLAVLWFAIM